MTPLELKLLRKQYHLTQADFGARLAPPVSRLTVYNWESGKFAIPVDIETRLTAADLLRPNATKETAKQKREREEAEAAIIQRSVETYRRIRAWPQYGYNHTAAMAYLAREGTTIDPRAYAAIVKEFPDILTDPNGNYPMTREQSAAIMSSKPSTETKLPK